jgi:hypothetical protein
MAELGGNLLSLDLVGPFVVQFKKGINDQPGSGYVYAPLCDNHHANVLTDNDDVSVPGNGDSPKGKYLYNLKGPKGATAYDLAHPDDESKLLIVPFAGDPLAAQHYHLMLRIPCPTVIIPLLTESVWIHRHGANNWVTRPDKVDEDIVDTPRARALRLIYKNCPQSPEIENEGRAIEFNAKALGIQETTHYSMSLRFAATGERSAGQADAYNCFCSSRSREMWPLSTGCDMYKWRVDFADLQDSLTEGGGANPRDCGAPLVVMQDWQQERT